MKKYETVEMEILEFDTEDVITTSGEGDIETSPLPIGGEN